MLNVVEGEQDLGSHSKEDSSETLVPTYHITRCHNKEDCHVNDRECISGIHIKVLSEILLSIIAIEVTL
jgi:hypothetical protein